MKIAVLFGSFNPLTNAHIAAMKTVLEHLNADKGLFVATNGQYLRRKTVKIDDPFYLSEEERKEIVSKACESEDKIEFWGYELGGINPRRYKTLCKIQRQYPDAEIYEIQGADKVGTISKFGDGEEYAAHIKFAVFERNGIDLPSLIDNDSLLSRHKDHFVLLSALDEKSLISSTEVRRRFYADEDYSDIVPEAVVEVLGRHKPSDFTVSYEERMKTIIRSGRFGINQACKEVYAENTALFNKWKNSIIAITKGEFDELKRKFGDNCSLEDGVFDITNEYKISNSVFTSLFSKSTYELRKRLFIYLKSTRYIVS